MPIFNAELNRIANDISASDLTCYVHTAAPSDGSPTNGRVPGLSAQTLAASSWSAASDGDVAYNQDVAFGEVDSGNERILSHWSLYRGSAPVAFGTISGDEAARTVAAGRHFTLNSGTIRINGSSS